MYSKVSTSKRTARRSIDSHVQKHLDLGTSHDALLHAQSIVDFFLEIGRHCTVARSLSKRKCEKVRETVLYKQEAPFFNSWTSELRHECTASMKTRQTKTSPTKEKSRYATPLVRVARFVEKQNKQHTRRTESGPTNKNRKLAL